MTVQPRPGWSARNYMEDRVAAAVRDGSLPESDVDACAARVLALAIVLGLVISVLYSHAKLTELSGEINEVNTQLAAARSEYDYLSTRMSDITSRASLQEVAEGQLGLVKLDPSQITYVQLEDESVIQKSTNTAGKLLGEVRTAALSLLNNLNP